MYLLGSKASAEKTQEVKEPELVSILEAWLESQKREVGHLDVDIHHIIVAVKDDVLRDLETGQKKQLVTWDSVPATPSPE